MPQHFIVCFTNKLKIDFSVLSCYNWCSKNIKLTSINNLKGDIKMKYVDFYGLPLEKGDHIFPVSGNSLKAYNRIIKYFEENNIYNYRPELIIVDNSYLCRGKKVKFICLEYEDYDSKLTPEIAQRSFVNTEDFSEYTTKQHFDNEEKKHKYVLSVGKKINADNIIDTGFKDIDGEIIYDKSIMIEAFDRGVVIEYIMKKDLVKGEYVLVKLLEQENIVDISILDHLVVIFTVEYI